VTAFICHVGYEVTADVVRRLADSVDPGLLTTVEAVVATVAGVEHAHARARWTGRVLRVEVEGWVDHGLTVSDADVIGQLAARAVAERVPEMSSFTFSARSSPFTSSEVSPAD
jgi:divalent metal cation (Fe/Co/Zn/Cd) transporter